MNEQSAKARKRGKRVAFLIGNSVFPHAPDLSPLSGPPNDVRRLAEIFAEEEIGGYDVHSFVNRRSNEVLPELEERLAELGREDFALVYYSGHGRLDRSGRLCLASAETRSSAILNTSIRVRSLTDLLYQSNVGNTLLLLDCCFSGAVGHDLRGSINDELAQNQSAAGHHVFTSSTDTEVSREEVDDASGEKLGAFTARLIEGLVSGDADSDGDGAISLHELRDYVQSSLHRQKPQYWGVAAFGNPLIALNHGKSEQLRVTRIKEQLREWVRQNYLDPVTYAQMLQALVRPETEVHKRSREILLGLASSTSFTPEIVRLTWHSFADAPNQHAPQPGADRMKESPPSATPAKIDGERVEPQAEPIVVAPAGREIKDSASIQTPSQPTTAKAPEPKGPPPKPVEVLPSPLAPARNKSSGLRRTFVLQYIRRRQFQLGTAGAVAAAAIIATLVIKPPPRAASPTTTTIPQQGQPVTDTATGTPVAAVAVQNGSMAGDSAAAKRDSSAGHQVEAPAAPAKHAPSAPARAPEATQRLFARAKELAERDDHAGAIPLFKRYLREQPGDVEAHFLYARSLQLTSDNETAEAEYRTAIRLRSDYTPALLGLGALLVHRGGHAREAIPLLERARQLAPTNSIPHTHLAIADVELNQLAQAEEHFRVALQLNGNDGEARSGFAAMLYLKGSASLKTGDTSAAVRAFEEAVRLAPPKGRDAQIAAATFARRGLSLHKPGSYPEARRLYEQALEIEPYNAIAYSGLLGIMHDVDYDYVGALRHAERWLERFPNDTSRLTEFLEAFVTAGADAQALAVFDKVRQVGLAPRLRVVVDALELVALARVGEEARLSQRKNDLRTLVQGLPAGTNYDWSFAGTLHYVSGFQSNRQWLTKLLTAIENNDREGILSALQ